MNKYIINVYPRDNIYQDYKFYATFDDYDPTPIDNDTPAFAPVGWGDTENEAMYVLLEQCI
jgi:hypothetical protein